MKDQQLAPILQKVEALRLSHQKRIQDARKWILVPLSIVVAAILLFVQGSSTGLVIAVGVAGIIGMIALAIAKVGGARKAFKEEFKQQAYGEMIKRLYPEVTYTPTQFISKEAFLESELFSRPDRYQGEDHFEGRTKQGWTYRFSEVHAESRSDNSYMTIFKGLLFVVDLPNPVHGRVKILPDTAERAFGAFGKMLQEKLGGLLQKKTDLVYFEEYPDFEKKFVVYSDNETLARHLLTEEMTRYLLLLQDARPKQPVRISIVNQQLFFAFSLSRDLFDPSVKDSVLEPAFVRQFTEEIAMGFDQLDIIEKLCTTMKIGTPPSSINAPLKSPKASPEKMPLPKKRPSISYKKSSSKDNPFLL